MSHPQQQQQQQARYLPHSNTQQQQQQQQAYNHSGMNTSAAASASVVSPAVETTTTIHYEHDAWQHMTRTVAHYQRLEQIGEGPYGQVYRAICLDTGQPVALKKMRLLSPGRGYWGMPLQ